MKKIVLLSIALGMLCSAEKNVEQQLVEKLLAHTLEKDLNEFNSNIHEVGKWELISLTALSSYLKKVGYDKNSKVELSDMTGNGDDYYNYYKVTGNNGTIMVIIHKRKKIDKIVTIDVK